MRRPRAPTREPPILSGSRRQHRSHPPRPRSTWIMLEAPVLPNEGDAVIVADLHHDHSPEWERALCDGGVEWHRRLSLQAGVGSLGRARCASSICRRTASGQLIPSNSYAKKASGLSTSCCRSLLCRFVLPLLLVTALVIRFDSPGSVFFRQERIGYRARPFRRSEIPHDARAGEGSPDRPRRRCDHQGR